MQRLTRTWGRIRKAWELAPHIDDLHAAFEEREGAALTVHERELLENTLVFSEIRADDVSVPRADVMALRKEATLAEALEMFATSVHSRLPVIGDNLDDVKGFVLLKDVVGAAHTLKGREQEFKLDSILRALPVVPESMPLPRVLQVMRREHVAIALVVDEFGGTSGLLTLRDILEQLVGDLIDEQNGRADTPLKDLGKGLFAVRGDVSLEDVDNVAGTQLVEKYGHEVESIGGAVMKAVGKVPAKGERVHLDARTEVTVTASNGRVILSLNLKVGA